MKTRISEMAKNDALVYHVPSRLALWASLFFVAETIAAALAAFSTANAIELLDEARFAEHIPARRIEAADSRQFPPLPARTTTGFASGSPSRNRSRARIPSFGLHSTVQMARDHRRFHLISIKHG